MESSVPGWEIVHTVEGWYDGPREGTAEYKGRTYYYRSIFLDSPDYNHGEDRFELTPLTPEALAWNLEREQIFNRWQSAIKEGLVTWTEGDEATFGSLPDERVRLGDLNIRLKTYFEGTKPDRLVRGRFDSPPLRVQWED